MSYFNFKVPSPLILCFYTILCAVDLIIKPQRWESESNGDRFYIKFSIFDLNIIDENVSIIKTNFHDFVIN